MVALAGPVPLDDLNRVGFRLCEKFRPAVPEGAEGGGAVRRLDRMQAAGGTLRV